MEKVSIDDVEPSTFDPENRTHDRRGLTEPLNAGDVAVARYVLEPGERFSGALHAHMDQEEIFLVVEGEATFRTREGEVTVSEDEAVRFATGEFQTGGNEGDEDLVAFALGAPRETEDVRIARIPGVGNVACPDCGHDNMQIPGTDGEPLVCPECNGELPVK
ncbi:cupin domain-containing protein [Halostella sp. PRR32]|uniref:cupin domain-containing protein n=1 Tax=Halostella sp. PRR32 TaxID=3098147 RepID=UPI002B1E1052|nr:cupin domain-containing protein [Halostella sp. PRR32]